MKFLTPQFVYFITDQETQRNLKALSKYFIFLAAIVGLYTGLFRLMMLYEGQDHSWLTGLYWTLTTMSTLGFGDITFQSDLGRIFSIVVLLSGIVLLLIVLPFAFVRFFYAPWLEAQLRHKAPRKAPKETEGHVILSCYDEVIAEELAERLTDQSIPYFVVESDPARAADLHADGISVVTGELDAVTTYDALRSGRARLIVANSDDATNTNAIVTVREKFPDVPIAAFAEDKDAVDVLELSGANYVFPLKHRLGEQLAHRVTVGTAHAHPVGRIKDLVIAEFPVHNTPLAGRTVADTRLRQLTGLNLVAYSERGELLPATADTVLSDYSVAVVVGTEEQVSSLDALFVIYEPNENPVVVVGGGKVGRAAARALKQRDIIVHMIEKDEVLLPRLTGLADRIFHGDAVDLAIVTQAGIEKTPSVILTGHDDAANIFQTIYFRKLNPDTRIVSRITHERNLEAIHRAGADFVLSYGSLAVTSLLSLIHDRDMVLAGEGVDLFVEPVPKSLAGKTLAGSEIGSATGLNVVAVQKPGGSALNPASTTELALGYELVMLGSAEQRSEFRKAFA